MRMCGAMLRYAHVIKKCRTTSRPEAAKVELLPEDLADIGKNRRRVQISLRRRRQKVMEHFLEHQNR